MSVVGLLQSIRFLYWVFIGIGRVAVDMDIHGYIHGYIHVWISDIGCLVYISMDICLFHFFDFLCLQATAVILHAITTYMHFPVNVCAFTEDIFLVSSNANILLFLLFMFYSNIHVQ